jgi:hypothetical protein
MARNVGRVLAVTPNSQIYRYFINRFAIMSKSVRTKHKKSRSEAERLLDLMLWFLELE